ncbi:MAG: SRPBCC domain-containing protein [Chloroflexota bacterium]
MTDAHVERIVPATPERTWHAFTDPRELSAWFWPPGFATEALLEPRAGGRLRIASAPADMAVEGEVRTAIAPTLLRLTWRWAGEDLTTEVAIELLPHGGDTRLVVDHRGFPTDAMAVEHAQGWSDCLDRLAPHLADTDARGPRA